jgi:peptidoglycan/LPS O-acetylase OafA/YrhL
MRSEFQKKHSVYFPHIDGLRAIAVILVVLFHIDKKIFSLGYLGVDIFFVISGYVITKQITEQYYKNEFSFLSFYVRRFKRIYPALILVILTSTIFYLYYGLHYDFNNFNLHLKTALFSLLGISNLFLSYRSRDYFFDSDKNPFIHTWSLGIEEQFYLIWPIIIVGLLCILKKNLDQNKKIFLFIIFIIIINVILNITEHKYSYLLNQFFSPSYRFWELMLGASLVFLKISKKFPISFFYIIFFILSYFILFSENIFFITVISCFFSALVIFNKNNNSNINIILSKPILTFIGKISYSIYLWHLPILIIGSFYYEVTKYIIEYLLIIFLMSYLSYILVECPIRFSKKYDKKIKNAILILLFLIPFIFYFKKNLNAKLDQNILNLHKSSFNYFTNKFGNNIFINNLTFYAKHGNCQLDWSYLANSNKNLEKITYNDWKNELLHNKNFSCYLKKNNNKFIMLIGDSSSTSLGSILDIDDYDSLIISLGGFNISDKYTALPVNEYNNKDFSRLERDKFYRNFVVKIFNELSHEYKNSYIVVSSRLDNTLTSSNIMIIDENKKNMKNKLNLIDYEKDINDFIKKFENNPKIIFFENMPQFKDTPAQCFSKIIINKNYNCNILKENALINHEANLIIKNLITTNNKKFYFFSLNHLICPNKICNFFFKNGISWLNDPVHANPRVLLDLEIRNYFKNEIDKLN